LATVYFMETRDERKLSLLYRKFVDIETGNHFGHSFSTSAKAQISDLKLVLRFPTSQLVKNRQSKSVLAQRVIV
jgi:hypothetical protein